MHRDPEALLRDIVEPSAAIDPEFVSCVVELNGGDTITGIVRIPGGRSHRFREEKIRQWRSSATLMPNRFRRLGDEKLRDLVAVLRSTPDPKK
jgi:hypothetical protein